MLPYTYSYSTYLQMTQNTFKRNLQCVTQRFSFQWRGVRKKIDKFDKTSHKAGIIIQVHEWQKLNLETLTIYLQHGTVTWITT